MLTNVHVSCIYHNKVCGTGICWFNDCKSSNIVDIFVQTFQSSQTLRQQRLQQNILHECKIVHTMYDHNTNVWQSIFFKSKRTSSHMWSSSCGKFMHFCLLLFTSSSNSMVSWTSPAANSRYTDSRSFETRQTLETIHRSVVLFDNW